MDQKVHDVEDVWMDAEYLYLAVDQRLYRISWTDCSPRLASADESQRLNFKVEASGYGIHWPELDEDLAISPLLQKAEALDGVIDRDQSEIGPGASSAGSPGLAEARTKYTAGSASSAGSQWIDRQLIPIARSLSPSRAAQLVDFARFLEAQSLAEALERESAGMAVIEADNARWDALLATDQSQSLLEKLADEALAERRAGRTKPMAFTDDGRIVPG